MNAKSYLALAIMSIGLGAILSMPAKGYEPDNGNGTFTNPLFYDEFSDPDLIRVGDDFYLTGTTMHTMPGLPVLHSKDLVNWELLTYAFDRLDLGPAFRMEDGKSIYGQGIWAPCFRYHDGTFYIFTNVNGHTTQLFTATDPAGPWTHRQMKRSLHDLSVLFDDDGKAYVIWGYQGIRFAQLNDDLTDIIPETEKVLIERDAGMGEGVHFYKVDGKYFITSAWFAGRMRMPCARADRPEGPYEVNQAISMDEDFGLAEGYRLQNGNPPPFRLTLPNTRSDGRMSLHQGGIVQTQKGEWWGFSMMDYNSVGRLTCLSPVTWKDGWPYFGLPGNLKRTPRTWVKPDTGHQVQPKSPYKRNDDFSGPELANVWQWNHVPVESKWSLAERPGYLRLNSMAAEDFWQARNTLTQRAMGPISIPTTQLDMQGMRDGDVAGLALLNMPYAWIGARKQGNKYLIEVTNQYTGSTATAPFNESRVWFRAKCDFLKEVAQLYYSTDGENFEALGDEFPLVFQLRTFQGVRYSLFHYNTKGTDGGFADFDSFVVDEPHPHGLMRPIPVGQEIALSLHGLGKCLAVRDGELSAIRIPANPSQADGTKFIVVDRGLGRVALKSGDRFVSVTKTDRGSGVSLKECQPGDSETFQWTENPYGDLILMSILTHRHLRVGPANQITADHPGPQPSRKDGSCFVWTRASDMKQMVLDATESESLRVATIEVGSQAKAISPDLFGIFFEDINYAADGGLYAELIQNRSFEYSRGDNRAWNSLTAWSLVSQDDSTGAVTGAVTAESGSPLNERNPHYAVLRADREGEAVSLRNEGFDGIPLVAGDGYNVSLFARIESASPGPISVQLQRVSGESLGAITFDKITDQWTQYTATIVPTSDDPNARLVVSISGAGSTAIDMVSLFPQKTFKNRPNGLRRDLAQVIADLKPRFIRFPGGCLAHGDGLENMYRWKDTIGPVEQRKAQRNIWRYHQTMGLGYFEYFQFCEDVGAKPLPVVPAGVCCQNSGNYLNLVPRGQQGIPMALMPQYVQEVLDLVEYANGPITSTWGAKRAEAGHPEPFGLEYLGVGNEDTITPVFKERFAMIREAVKAKYPQLVVIGTTGPATDGFDYEEGWKFADAIELEMVDEHGYKSPEWFWGNLDRFDQSDRERSQIYLGEYAAHEPNRSNTLRSALSEAAYMTTLERNGDHVRLSSYAPLLSKRGRTQWRPDLIYFDNHSITPSINYYVQQLFGIHAGDEYFPTKVKIGEGTPSTADQSHQDGIQLGSWNSQARFDNVRITKGNEVILDEAFEQLSPEWEKTSGIWEVKEGELQQSSDKEPAIAKFNFPADRTGYTLTLRAMKPSGTEGFLIGFGTTDADEHFWWNIGGWQNTMHALQRFRDGGSSIVGPTVRGAIESNRWYDIKIELTEERIRCYLDSELIHDLKYSFLAQTDDISASCVRETQSGDLIVKVVSKSKDAVSATIDLSAMEPLGLTAQMTILSGDAQAENRFGDLPSVLPHTSAIKVDAKQELELPPHSFTILRFEAK
ncbi:family 43 glycosylhydrolase [Planctomycetes bacterium CA13]